MAVNPFQRLMSLLIIGIIAIIIWYLIKMSGILPDINTPSQETEHYHSVTHNSDTVTIPAIPIVGSGEVKPLIKYIIRKMYYPVHDTLVVQDSIFVKDSLPEIKFYDTLNGDTIYFHAYPKYISIFDYWNVDYEIKHKPNFIIYDSVIIKDSTIITKKENPYIKWLYFGGGILLYYGVKSAVKEK